MKHLTDPIEVYNMAAGNTAYFDGFTVPPFWYGDYILIKLFWR